MGGDTCWFEIEFRRADLPKFDEILEKHLDDEGKWWDDELGDDPDSAMMKVSVSEANGAWSDETKGLAGVGLSFRTEHGGGNEYGPCVLVCYEGDLVECSADFDGNPVIPVRDIRDSGIDKEAAKACYKFWYLVHRMEEEPEIT